MDKMKKEELEITISDSDRIECAIRHIQTAVDVDPWAVEIAVKAMKTQLPGEGTTSDLISRQDAIEVLGVFTQADALGHTPKQIVEALPSAQPEIEERKEEYAQNVPKEDLISRKAAIDALDCINGTEEVLRSLPSAQPEPCEDAVSRDSVKFLLCKETCHPGAFCPDGFCREICEKVDALPSATPKQRMGEWIPVSEKLPEKYGNYLISIHGEDEPDIGTINPNDKRGWSLCDANGFYWASDKELIVTAWMPLPEPYRAERRTDERFDRTAGGDQEAEENGYSSIY